MKSIAMIGTGIMGRGMVKNLAKEGFFINAYSRSKEKIADLEAENVKLFSSIPLATQGVDLAVLCLTTDDVVESAFREIQSVKYILDTGTTSWELTHKMRKESTDRGVEFFDCPMTGSKLAAESGEILFMFGGTEEEAFPLKKFLEACGKKTVYCGAIGNGQKVKFSLNMVQAGIYQVLLEGWKLSRTLGVSDSDFYEVIDNSAAKSGISLVKLSKAMKEDYETHFALKNMYKDILHSLREASSHKISLPMCERLDKVYRKGIESGYGEEDFLALAKSSLFDNTNL